MYLFIFYVFNFSLFFTFAAKMPGKRSYSPSALTRAFVAAKEDGISVRQAARQFNVPLTTLRDRVDGRVYIDCCTMGPAPLFMQLEEARLIEHLNEMAAYGYGYSREEIVDLATEYAVQLGKRPKNQPLTLQWFRKFRGRWPDVKVLKPTVLSLI